MGVSESKNITSESIYESLTVAFKANIGEISNNITKIFNKDDFGHDDYKFIKKLCSYNNHVIDMAKTLDVVEFPEKLKEQWNQVDNSKLPHFFMYAKDKEEEKVLDKNNSTVNRLGDLIIDKRIHFKSVVGKFDYKKLMWTPNIKDDTPVIDEETDKKIIDTYTHLDQNKRYYLDVNEDELDSKKQYVYVVIREKLLDICSDAHKVNDVLVRYLFNKKDSKYKSTLWESFGQEIVEALRKNVLNEVDCFGCGKVINEPRQRQVRCDKCQKEYRKRQDRERKRREKENLNKVSA
ncbi:hypothetical protein [Bacillus sp. SD088]|uniref:hypothetical protein n=1 Tax=Bacillus sp. SD088 TaxID=2782012 RepID=UPI001A961FA1|nr:hypothetical protein [Bacillus sp. SD088]MBO0995930.1 hypothetical protein [Bacillus sp. SD088]